MTYSSPAQNNPPVAAPPKDLRKMSQDSRPNDLGHEGMESNIKRNTSGEGERQDRGD